MADVDLIAEVLARHRTRDVGRRKDGAYEWWYECDCGEWRSDPFTPVDLDAADRAQADGLRHEAEQIAEAMQHGATEATGAEPESTVGDPSESVSAIKAVV